MDRFWFSAGILIIFLIGSAITLAILMKGETRIGQILIPLFLSFGVGVAFTGILVYIWINLTGRLSQNYIYFEIAAAAILTLIGLGVIKLKKASIAIPPRVAGRIPFAPLFLGGIFLVATGLSANNFYTQMILRTRGGWDSWAFWNLNAEFIFKGGDSWTNLLLNTIPWVNPDYPLLLPGSIARLWYYFGRDSYLIPSIIGGLFMLATIFLIITALSQLRGIKTGLTGGILLLSIPMFVFWSSQQYADVPVGYYFLASIVCQVYAIKFPNRRGYLILSGMMVGFSVWVKNEGWLFLLSFTVSLLASFIFLRKKIRMKDLLWITAGMLPGIVTAAHFKIFLAPPNDIMGQGLSTIFERILEFDRYSKILQWAAGVAFNIKSPYCVPIWIALILLLMYGINRHALQSVGFLVSSLTVILMLFGFFIIFVISPHDLDWHLGTALNRLFIQIWPTIVFTAGLLTRPSRAGAVDDEGHLAAQESSQI